MRFTRALRQHQPMIKFLGKRTTPKQVDHTPHAHPASPSTSLPESFASYRQKAQQHGPINRGQPSQAPSSSSAAAAAAPYGAIGGRSGRQLGSVQPKEGEFWDRSELPMRFRRTPWSQMEIDAVETGGASLF